MRKLIAIAILLTAGQAWGATYYVSNTTSGTYQTGNDANSTAQAQSKDTPWLTMTGAEAKAANGDTVYVNAGTYPENDGTFHCLSTAKAINWIADGVVVVQSYSSTSYVLVSGGTTAATTFTGFTFDATKVNGATNPTSAVYFASNSTNKVFTNCTFKEAITQLIYWTATAGFTLTSPVFANTGAAIVGIKADNAGASTVTVTGLSATGAYSKIASAVNDTAAWSFTNGGTINISATNNIFDGQVGGDWTVSGHTVTLAGTPAKLFNASTTAKTGVITIQNNNITYDNVSSAAIINVSSGGHNVTVSGNTITAQVAGQAQSGIYISPNSGTPTVSIDNNIVDFQGTTYSSTAIAPIQMRSAGGIYSPSITNNIVRTTQTGGFGIQVGTDVSSAQDNYLDNATITGNNLYGAFYYNRDEATVGTHGIEFGWNTGATISKNYINGFGYGIVVKSSNAKGTYTIGGVKQNLLVDNGGTGTGGVFLRAKGVVDLPVYNNTFYLNSSYIATTNGIINITEGDTSTENSTGTLIKNNLFIGKNGYGFIVVANDGSTLDNTNVDYNMYWNQTSAATADFTVGATVYANWADWVAAGYDANSPASADPLVTSSSDYRLQSSSPAINAGVDVGLTSDIRGMVVPQGSAPDIGAYEFGPGDPGFLKGVYRGRMGIHWLW